MLRSVVFFTFVAALTFNAFAQPDPATVYAWFKADSGALTNASGTITNWQNQATSVTNTASRNLDHISGTATGLAVITPSGTSTVVRLDGTDAMWGTSANFGSLASNRTLVAYCRLTSTNDGFLFDGSTSGGMTRAQVRNGSWQVGLQPSPLSSGANADTNTLPATNNVWQAHVFSFEKLASSTRVKHAITGSGTSTYTNSETVGLGGLIVGENVSAARGLAVDVAEFIVYDRVLGGTEQSNVLSYLTAKWGSPTNASLPDMAVVFCTAVQSNRTVPNFGLHHVLDAQVVTTGQGNAVSLTNITFTLAGSTDAAADVAAVKVYFTGTTNQFRTLVPFAFYNGPMSGTISLTGSQVLQGGTNHFWIAVEPKPRTPWGHVLDAELVSLGVSGTNGGTKLPSIAAPPEFLTVGNAPFYSVLRARGDNGSFEFRIPGLAVTTNGTLIATFDVRWDAINDLPANVDVACLRSTDMGNTWGPMITVLDFDKNVSGSSGNGVGDAAVLVDRQTGTIWVAALWSYGNHSLAGSLTGTATNRTGQYVLARSDDDGLTWSAPINITVQAKANTNWGCAFQGPGNGIQLRNGTLVFPSQHTQPGGGQGKVFFIYSTNHGASWAVSPDVTTNASPTMNENQIVELNSGQIMTSMRMSAGGGGFRGWSTYTPGSSLSNGTWSPLVLNLPDPICQHSDAARRIFPGVRLLNYEESVQLALERLEAGKVETIWSDALSTSAGDELPVTLTTREGMEMEVRQRLVRATPSVVFRAFSSLGGARGWLSMNWAWQMRGILDRMAGGVGMRRGRRHPTEVRTGDAVDFWRVERVEESRLLRLRAEMKVPGRAWLEFAVVPHEAGGSLLTQAALFAPKGLLGWLYWFAMYPFHARIFSEMIRQIARMAEVEEANGERSAESSSPGTFAASDATTAMSPNEGAR